MNRTLRNEGMHPRAGAVVALLDADLPLQVQHARKRGTNAEALCEAGDGQFASLNIGVTCAECKRLMRRNERRRERRAERRGQ